MITNRISTFLVSVGLILAANASHAAMVAQWSFENRGMDSSGNGLTAYEAGNVVFQADTSPEAIAELGTSAYFDGNASNELKVLHNDLLNFTTSFTFAMWIKPSTIFGSLLGRYANAGSSYGVYVNEPNHTIGPILYYDSSPRYYEYRNVGIVSTEWQHVVVTYDNSNVKIYRNTVLGSNQSSTGSIVQTVNPLFIGSLWGAGDASYQYTGYMDEVTLFDTALDQTEIEALYNNSLIPQTAIPEPVSMILMSLGVLGILARKIIGRK